MPFIFFASDILIFFFFLDLAHDLPEGSFLHLLHFSFLCAHRWVAVAFSLFQNSEKRKSFNTPTKALESLALRWKIFTDCCFDTNV